MMRRACMLRLPLLLITVLPAPALTSSARAQEHVMSKVDVAWNRYYPMAEIETMLHRFAEAYPDLVTLQSIGKSWEGRDTWVITVTGNTPDIKPDDKPAMWIDGSIHANEVQATEVVLYTLYYLTKMYGVNPMLTDLLDRVTFHLCPVVSPDSRVAWFERAATPHSFRHNQRPIDYDLDGRINEDPPDDLDGDGSITRMWKRDPGGQWVQDRFDPRVFTRVPPGEKGDWTPVGTEGIDRDDDGRVSEDGPGGYDMNRNWPADWQPDYVQGGAGLYPLSSPETRSIARFMMERPNLAAAQSYHNTGGMILRGPGDESRENFYPGPDRSVYDQIAREGEKMLPYYRYLVIWRDLYKVHGGFITWAAESLGIFGFTNEMWTTGKYFQGADGRPDAEMMRFFGDHLQFGQTWTDFTEVDHPEHGRVLVGGGNKWSSRSTPTFMLEEECHRNFAFTVFHADQMPLLSLDRMETRALGGDLWEVTMEIRNERRIPTRSRLQQTRRIGTHDRLEVTAPDGVAVVAAGSLDSWWSRQMDEQRFEPGRLLVPGGIPGQGTRIFRFLVTGAEGSELSFVYRAERSLDLHITAKLEAVAQP